MKRVVLLVVVAVMAVGVAFSADMNYGIRTGLSLSSMSLDPELDEWGPPAGYKMVYDVEDPDVAEYMGYNFGEWLNRFQFSAAVGARYDITGTFFGELRYTYGFSNVISEDQELLPEELEAIPRTLTIGLGINL